METNRENKNGGNGSNVQNGGPKAIGIVKALFNPGNMAITGGALNSLVPDDVHQAIRRHLLGDWGDVSKEDKESNDRALKEGSRLLSSYKDRRGTKFWIITEYDRSLTTILLPDEY